MAVLALEAGLWAELGCQGEAPISEAKPGSKDMTEPSCTTKIMSHAVGKSATQGSTLALLCYLAWCHDMALPMPVLPH